MSYLLRRLGSGPHGPIRRNVNDSLACAASVSRWSASTKPLPLSARRTHGIADGRSRATNEEPRIERCADNADGAIVGSTRRSRTSGVCALRGCLVCVHSRVACWHDHRTSPTFVRSPDASLATPARVRRRLSTVSAARSSSSGEYDGTAAIGTEGTESVCPQFRVGAMPLRRYSLLGVRLIGTSGRRPHQCARTSCSLGRAWKTRS